MTKKYYLAPEAEFLMLIPVENLAAWSWGNYEPATGASAVTPTIETVWEKPWQFDQSDESYKVN